MRRPVLPLATAVLALVVSTATSAADTEPDRPRPNFFDQSAQIQDFLASTILPRLAKVCAERDPAFDARFGPAFVTWRRAHLQDVISGETMLRTMQPKAGMTNDEAIAKLADEAEGRLRAASMPDAEHECAAMLADLEGQAAPGH